MIINGTGRDGVWFRGNSVTPRPTNENTFYPASNVGRATFTDSPNAIGLSLTIDPGERTRSVFFCNFFLFFCSFLAKGYLVRGHIYTLWIFSFQTGTCTGSLDASGKRRCTLDDANLPPNGMGLFASGIVPPNGGAFVLSGFYGVPNNDIGVRATTGNPTTNYEFQFRLASSGPPSNTQNQEVQEQEFYRQWTTVGQWTDFLLKFPARPCSSH